MNHQTLALYAAVFAALATGFALGAEFAGRMAIQTYTLAKPDWVVTVQRVRTAALVAGGVLLVGATVLSERAQE